MSDRKIIDYQIICSLDESKYNFVGYVLRMMESGWQPLGSPFMRNNDKEMCQALVKYE